MSFLQVEVDGFVNPFLENAGNFFHGINHGGELDVQPGCKGASYFYNIPCLGLDNKVLEFSEILLKAIVLLGHYLSEDIEFISGSLHMVVWIEHGGEVGHLYLWVGHFAIPSFSKVTSLTLAHFC